MTSAGINPTRPSIARVYDYWLGGKDNFASDRELADKIVKRMPQIPEMARANRDWIIRAVSLAVESGVRQILDVGCGLPTSAPGLPNVHEVAQSIAPDTRVLYMDNDPIVQAHGRALLATNAHTQLEEGDLRELDKTLASLTFLDLSKPVLLLLAAVLHFFPDAGEREPYQLVRSIMDQLPAGSYLAITHGQDTPETRAVSADYTVASAQLRGPEEVSAFFAGLDLVEPGVVRLHEWRPREDSPFDEPVAVLGGLARKP
ncbi:SAM-dependent methyltransferase [Nonomuraea sp. NPDC050536]|uniref:SAM-dependent methyltransferase n=1 Tax=Nonomuraea sp. NPDC050536 TaxID=3364366 RepID=UPI0037CC8151